MRAAFVAGSIALIGVAALLAPSGSGQSTYAGVARAGEGKLISAITRGTRVRRTYPAREEVREAKKVASAAAGSVAFAVIGPGGGIRGHEEKRQFSSASISKAMLLAAYLRSHKGRLDSAIASTLRAMVTASDNDAAGTIYAIVGDEGLRRVARRADMHDFEPDPGFWGGAQVTAADMARFFYRLDHNLAGPHRGFGRKLLASVIGPQRWGIPAAAGKDWSLWFKGGWRPGGTGTSGAVSHQAAQLRYRDGTRVAIAVLTDQTPGEGAGYSTIEEIARKLLNPAP